MPLDQLTMPIHGPSITSLVGEFCYSILTLTKMVNSSIWALNSWTSFTCFKWPTPIPICGLTCTSPTQSSMPPPRHCQQLLIGMLEPLMSFAHELAKTVDKPNWVHVVVSCGFFVAWSQPPTYVNEVQGLRAHILVIILTVCLLVVNMLKTPYSK